MGTMTRREFSRLGMAAGALMAGGLSRLGGAEALGLPLGLQLYSVRELLPKDFQGTLNKLGQLGYREVEAAGFYDKSPAEIQQAMKTAGLRCVSAHYPYAKLAPNLDAILQFHKALGVPNIVCASPGRKPGGATEGNLSIEDWRWNAQQFNEIGKKIKAAGMQFAYHNHYHEFQAVDGTVPYDVLLKETNPAVVDFELDCGWVAVGGGNPMEVIRQNKARIHMLHIKDFAKSDKPFSDQNRPTPVILGQGFVPLKQIFEARKQAGTIRHCFVEQEAFPKEPFEVLKEDAEFMRSIPG